MPSDPDRSIPSSALWTAVFLLVVAPSVGAQQGNSVSFRRDIAPVLLEQCLPCHGPKKTEGGFRVDSYTRLMQAGDSELASITPGDVDDSEVYRRIASEDPSERMPLEGDPLPSEVVERFGRWIEQGAKFDGPDPSAPLVAIIPPPQYPPPPETYDRPLPVTALAFTPDSRHLLVSGYHEVLQWDWSSQQLARRITNVPQRIYGLAVHPSEPVLAVAGGEPGGIGDVRLVDLPSGKVQRVLSATFDVATAVVFHPSEPLVATGAADNVLRLIRTTDGTVVRQITAHADWILAVAFSPDGSLVASASRDNSVKVFQTATGELVVSYSEHQSPVHGVVFEEDGQKVWSGGGDRKIHLWSVKDGKKQREFSCGGEVFALAASPQYVFAAGADRQVRLFRRKDGNAGPTWKGPSEWLVGLAARPDGTHVAAGTFDGMVYLWEVASGKLLKSFRPYP